MFSAVLWGVGGAWWSISLCLVRILGSVAEYITAALDDVRPNTMALPAGGTPFASLLSVVTHAAQARTALAGV